MAPEEVKDYISSVANWSLSVKATMEDKIIGCYIFNEDSVMEFASCQKEDLSKYKDLKAIQGVGLAVLPEYQGTGTGKKLRDYPLHLNYDYIWGQHLKGLHNIDNWVKFGRRVVADCGDIFVTLMDLKSHINEELEKNHIYQNHGHTCGPTCVQMVADYLGIKYTDSKQIESLCNCSTETGTIDTGIKNALDSLGIKNKQNTEGKDEVSAIAFLDNSLSDGNVFIMRTLTKGVKHWIVVYNKDNEHYYVADPWLGKIKYTPEQIIAIWKPRNYDGFTVFK